MTAAENLEETEQLEDQGQESPEALAAEEKDAVVEESEESLEQSVEQEQAPENENTVEVVSQPQAEAEPPESVGQDDEEEENPALQLPREKRMALVEAVLYAHGAPLGLTELSEVTGLPREEIDELLESLQQVSRDDSSGVDLVKVAGKFQYRTKVEFAPYLHRLRAEKPKRLSRPALETLAIVAYRQPLTRGDIEKIRGVDCTPTLKTLMDRGLVKIVGYSSTVGQPALYATTEEFLHVFGLGGLPELPALRDINLFEEDPGETSEEVFSNRGTESEESGTGKSVQV